MRHRDHWDIFLDRFVSLDVEFQTGGGVGKLRGLRQRFRDRRELITELDIHVVAKVEVQEVGGVGISCIQPSR